MPKGFLTNFAKLATLLILAASMHYYFIHETMRGDWKASEQLNVEIARRTITTDIVSVVRDLTFLTRHLEQQGLFDLPENEWKRRLALEFSALSESKRLYDQVRFLDVHGMEIVRINYFDKQAHRVPESSLQDKSGRDYFVEARQLDRGKIYISPLDLNIEYGRIEQPLKPVIRLLMPQFDGEGRKKGVIVLNYLAQQLIDNLIQASGNVHSPLELVNHDGYWLSSPNEEDQWGFVLGHDRKMPQRYPDAWMRIVSKESGQFEVADQLFTFATVRLGQAVREAIEPPEPGVNFLQGADRDWKIVARASPKLLTTSVRHFRDFQLPFYAATFALTLLGAWTLSRVRERQLLIEAQSEVELRDAYAELEQAHKHIKESEAWHRALVENMAEGLIVTDRCGVIQSFNQAAELIFGYTAGDIIGCNVNILIPAEVREDHDVYVATYRSMEPVTAMGGHGNIQGLRADGSKFDVEITLQSRYINGKRCNIALVRDVSHRKQAERAVQQKNEALARSNAELERFAYVASHDLQEPLRTMSSFVQLLAQRYHGNLDADADKWITYIVEASSRMKQLIQDLLSYSRINSHGGKPEPVAVGDVLDALLTDFSSIISQQQSDITHDPMPIVIADPGQLRQLLQNLIGNAMKYRAPKRTPKIHISAERLPDSWRFSVRDNGIGIEQKYFARIFEIFQRLHSHSHYAGTGIGLAVCKRIVERHGGRIWLESTPGEGSTFFFTMQAADANISIS